MQRFEIIYTEDMALERIEEKLDRLFTRIDSIDSTVAGINSRLNNLEQNLEVKYSELEQKICNVESSQEFISQQYDNMKLVNNNLMIQQRAQDKELVQMKVALDNLSNELNQERSARNVSEQYHRTSYNIKVCGIPIQAGEENSDSTSNHVTRDIIEKLASVCEIKNFKINQIDVCHRIGSNVFSPIIIKFYKKADRFNFFNQKKLLINLKLGDLGIEVSAEQIAILKGTKTPETVKYGRGGRRMNHSRPQSTWFNKDGKLKLIKIYMQESLTEMNGELLKLAKDAARASNYKYIGYTIKGEVRVKLNDSAKYIAIKSKKDIEKIN